MGINAEYMGLQLTLTLPLMPPPLLSTTLSTPTIMLVKFTPQPSHTFTKISLLSPTPMSKLQLNPTSTLKSQLPPMSTLKLQLPPMSTKLLHQSNTPLHPLPLQPLKLPTPGTLPPTMQATLTPDTLMPTSDTPDTLTPLPLPSPPLPPHKFKT